MKGRWLRLVCCASLALACESPPSNRRTVNPIHVVDAGGQDAGSNAEQPISTEVPTNTTLPTSSPSASGGAPSSEPANSDAHTPRPVDAGQPHVVYWGLQPGSPGADAGVVDEALVRLEVMALGSRIMTHVSSAAGDFAELERVPDLDWVLTLPAEAFATMDDAEVDAWVERAWQLGDAVRFLVLGQHLETDFAALPAAERALLVRRLEGALQRAKAHPSKPAGASVGVGFVSFVSAPAALLAAADVVALSFSGIEASGAVTPPDAAFEQLRTSVQQWSAFRVPLILQDLAYPSATGDAHQRQFFAAINEWFSGPSAPDVRAVVVSSLNPPATADCEHWADEWEVESGAEARCSVGMRHRDGEPKPALNEVIELLAQFAQL